MLASLFGLGRIADRRATVRKRPAARSRVGEFDQLEARTLLSTGPHPRIINGDEIDDQTGIVNGSPTSGFPSVGRVGDRRGSFCTGTLIDPQFVLTAGHCAEDLGATAGRFIIGGTSYSTSQVIVHPAYNGNRIGVDDAANDIAIFQLSVALTGITASPIFRGTPHVGDVLTLVGFGAGGTGAGHDGTFGTKRAGTTPIDGVTARRILWTFDNNSESNTAPGDSGGPAYLLVGGVYYVAGVTSGGDRANAGIGDHSYDTRVDAYASWIDSIVGSTPPVPDGGTDDHADEFAVDATPLTVSAGGTFHHTGSLEVAGDRDLYRLNVATPGTLDVSLTKLTEQLDTYLRVYDAAGNLVSFDDDSGPSNDSRLTVFVHAGTYYISAGAYEDASTGDYLLDGDVVSDDHGDSLLSASEITLGLAGDAYGSGNLERSDDRDFFRFVANRSGLSTIELRASTSSLDTVLQVFNARGRRIASNDDSQGTTDSRVQIKLRARDTYFIEATGYGGSQGNYTVRIAPAFTRLRGHGRSVPFRSVEVEHDSKSISDLKSQSASLKEGELESQKRRALRQMAARTQSHWESIGDRQARERAASDDRAGCDRVDVFDSLLAHDEGLAGPV